MASEPDVTRLVQDTASAYGCLDYLFNNAGIAIGGDARDLTLDHWRRVLDVDLYGVLHGMRSAYPIMAGQGSGHIVNTSSAAAAFFAAPGSVPGVSAGLTAAVPGSLPASQPGAGETVMAGRIRWPDAVDALGAAAVSALHASGRHAPAGRLQ